MDEARSVLQAAYRQSVLHRIGVFWKKAWAESCLRALLVWLLSLPSLDEGSAIRRGMSRINARLGSCDRLNRAIDGSFLHRIWAGICCAGRRSFFLGHVFRNGMTGVLLLILALYTPIDYLLRDVFAIPVVSSGWDEGLLILAMLWVILLRVREQPSLPAAASPLDFPVGQFLLVCLFLFVVLFTRPQINRDGLRATAQYILWFYLVTRLIRNREQLHMVYYVMVAVAAVISLHGIYQFIVAAPIPSHWVDQSESAVRTRVFSIFGSPNIMGDYMVMFAPMMAALAYCLKNKAMKLVCWFFTFTMCFSCLFTMSRGAWIAMVVAVLIFAALVDRRLILLMLLAFVAALFLPFVASRIGYLFTSEYAESAARGGRSVRWEKAIEYLYSNNPVFGIGFGRFGGAVAMQHQESVWMKYFYTDNYYVKILAENGYVGLVSFVLMMLGVVWCGLRGWFRKRHTAVSPLCAGMLASLSGVLVHCYFENIFEEPYMAASFWTIAAMMVYLGFIEDRISVAE